MILCEKCGRVIQSYEVKYRLELGGRRVNVCNEDAKDLLKAQEAPKPTAAKPVTAPSGAPAQSTSAAPGPPARLEDRPQP